MAVSSISHHGFASNAKKRVVSKEEPVSECQNNSVDLAFENHLSIFLIRPLTSSGSAWLEENVGDAETLTFGGAIVCEPSFIEAIYRGAISEGLVCG